MLTDLIRKELTLAIQEERGGEVIGYLLEGSPGGQVFYRIRNPSPQGEFFLSNYESDRLQRYARARGLMIRAFIHSHRRSCSPSDVDIDQLHNQKTPLPWVIVSIGEHGALQYQTFRP